MNRKRANPIIRRPTFPKCSLQFSILCILFTAALCLGIPTAWAEPVEVHHPEGTLHGFLALTTLDGKSLAVGDLYQTVEGDRVTSHLVFHFKDGSLDDETTVFTQQGTFKLISDHHVQKGPFFPTATDFSIDAASGEVVVKTSGKDGKENVKSQHMDMPADLCNGLVTPVTKNINPESPETKVSMIVATPEPRLVTLAFSPLPTEPFSLAGASRKALSYNIKFELGGLAGFVAPLIGKKPPDVQISILGGELPTFVKEVGPTYAEGPILSIKLVSPVWPRSSRTVPHKGQ